MVMNFICVLLKHCILEIELFLGINPYEWARDLCTTHPWIKKQVDVLVEKSLIRLVSCTEILQKLMSKFHDFLHSDILALLQITQRQTSFLVPLHLWESANV